MYRLWLFENRKNRGLTQQQVADLIGISRAYYAQLETGARRLTLKRAKALSQVLDIPWNMFYDNE